MRRVLFGAWCLIAAGALGCTLLGAQSKVRAGDLFEPGDPKYDAYFKDVHDLQVSAIGWTDDRKAACRPLVDVLKLPPDSADVSIVQGTHERILAVTRDVGPTKLEASSSDVHLTVANVGKVDDSTRELFKAIETCAHTQLERAKTLKDVPGKVDTLTKTGRDLEPHVREDFIKRGGRAAQNVQDELRASYEVMSNLSKDARVQAQAAEDFVADLQRGVVTEPGETPAGGVPAPGGGTASHEKEHEHETSDTKPPPPAPKKHGKKSSSSSSSGDDAPAAKPKPKPKPADTGEVFNP